MNSNLSDANDPRGQILLDACPSLRVLRNRVDFTYVHNSGSTSSLDFLLCSPDLRTHGDCEVDIGFCVSDHLPVANTFIINDLLNNAPNDAPKEKKWFQKTEWQKANLAMFRSVCDGILEKIKVPFQLLLQSSPIACDEKQILLNIYCSEITHALRCAEKTAVPIRKVRIGSEVPGWSENPALVNACRQAKMWYSVWIDSGRPKHGVVNSVRLYTKRQFSKCLALHRYRVIDENSESLRVDPNKIWKFIKKNRSAKAPSNESAPSESEWNSYFASKFAAPDPELECKFERDLDLCLESLEPDLGHSVSVSDVRSAILKLKKKYSKGVDNICGMHLILGSELLTVHLALMFQMIFSCGLVPDIFCTGVITPVIKKGKDPSECCSYRPITVAPVFCKLMELLVIEEIKYVCSTPDSQFGFKRNISREHVHSLLSNVLLDADAKGETVVLAGHDVRGAFDSGIHAQLLVSAFKRGLDRSIIATYRNMYFKLKVRVRVLKNQSPTVSDFLIPVRKGIRQGALSSPPLYNNSIIEAQKTVKTCFIFRGIDLSLVNYADDILNLSRSVSGIESNFRVLSNEYANIGLEFNSSKSEVVVFNCRKKELAPVIFAPGSNTVTAAASMTYLGLPIGSNLKATRSCLINDLKQKVQKAYGMILSCKRLYNRRILARIFNSFATPHILALSPFWSLLTVDDKKQSVQCSISLQNICLAFPPGKETARFQHVTDSDPFVVILTRREKFLKSLDPTHSMFEAIVSTM